MTTPEAIPGPAIGCLTISGMSRLYNCGRTYIYEEIKAGRLIARKAGTKTLIRRQDAEDWAAALPLMGSGK